MQAFQGIQPLQRENHVTIGYALNLRVLLQAEQIDRRVIRDILKEKVPGWSSEQPSVAEPHPSPRFSPLEQSTRNSEKPSREGESDASAGTLQQRYGFWTISNVSSDRPEPALTTTVTRRPKINLNMKIPIEESSDELNGPAVQRPISLINHTGYTAETPSEEQVLKLPKAVNEAMRFD